MKIGLTFFLRNGDRSIWANGADMNTVFLWMLLEQIPGAEVFAINGGESEVAPAGMMLAGLGIKFVKMADVVDQLDLLISAAAQVSAEDVASVRAHGGRAVLYQFGNAFVIDGERIIHNKPAGAIFNGARFDEVWTTPQHMETCGSYWETCHRCPVRVLPHIWEPTFVDAAIREFPDGLTFGYQPGRAKKRAAILEPNINIVKTCIIPMLVCENAHRRCPGLLESVMVTNAIGLKPHLTFQKFASNLDIVRDGLASFEGRFNTPWFMAKHADVMVAHQDHNALNYAYYDALYGGYPLVHNSDLLPDGIGYRYNGFDAHDGGDTLVAALLTHDHRADAYRADASGFLDTVRATAPSNVETHRRAIADVMARA